MIRKFKVLGLALVAVMAVSAVASATASAYFEAESAPVRFTRSANNTQSFHYTSGGFAVNCSTVGGEGEVASTATSEATFHPTYSGCTTILGNADVTFNQCDYRFTSAQGSTSVTPHIICGSGTWIKITVTEGSTTNSLCTITLHAQTPGGTVTLSNVGSGTTRELTIASSVTGIAGEREGSSLCGAATSTTGTYSGSVTVTGENPSTNAHIGIFTD